MSWASHPTTEMPEAQPQPVGRHRRRQNTIHVIVATVLLAMLVAGAMFSPVLIGWPPPSRPAAANPTTAPAAAAAGASATSAPSRATAVTSSAPTTRLATTAASRPNSVESMEDQIFALTNAERARTQNCPALRHDDKLRTAAQLHAADMASYGYHSHTGHDGSSPVQRLNQAGYDGARYGWAENVARGYPTVAAAMAGWMSSSGHRANILNCSLKAIGVGAARGADGQLYFTQDFGGR